MGLSAHNLPPHLVSLHPKLEFMMPSPEALRQPLVWMDLEMTGLDPDEDRILEIAVLVTDGDLATVIEGPDIIVHQPDAVLDGMDEWNTTHHGESGLVERVRASEVTDAEAEAQVLEFLQRHVDATVAPLAGNSIHQDRAFLRRWMPALHAYLHYRNVDVSTVKELARRWYPGALPPAKGDTHRAREHFRESIAELRFYRNQLFRAPDPPLQSRT